MRYPSLFLGLVLRAFAWAFFALRCLHSYIHLGSNNVSVRFFTFGASLVALAGLWGCVLVRLIQ